MRSHGCRWDADGVLAIPRDQQESAVAACPAASRLSLQDSKRPAVQRVPGIDHGHRLIVDPIFWKEMIMNGRRSTK